MKTCPQCAKTFPDSERFCDADGSALAQAGTARQTKMVTGQEQAAIECPVCGGKAEPGELICNFCGARLEAGGLAASSEPATKAPSRSGPVSQGPVTTRQHFEDEPPTDAQATRGRGAFGRIGYVVAAVVALAAGAWFASYLSKSPQQKTAVESTPLPAASPAAIAGPMVALASKVGLQVTGESAAAPERDQTAAKKAFADNNPRLVEAYARGLGTDSELHDGMSVRLRVSPNGEVNDGKVRVSTAPNPSLDADVVKAMMAWRFAPFGGSAVEVDYPITFSRNATEQNEIDSALADKLAHLSPTELPEYASATPPAISTPEAALAPTALPSVAALPPPETRPAVHETHKPRVAIASPKPSLLKVVQSRLHEENKFSRVKAYTDRGTVTLFGKVFDDETKLAAEHAVRGVGGVNGVVDTLSTDKAEWADNEAKINRELQNSGLAKVTAKVIGRDAYLDGEVTTDAERQRAVTVAQQAAPVTVRTNLIRVVPGGIF